MSHNLEVERSQRYFNPVSLGVNTNMLARPFMWLMNALGVFNNRRDNAQELKACLEGGAKLIEFEIVGVTAFFAIKKN